MNKIDEKEIKKEFYIPDLYKQKWNRIASIIANILEVPSALVIHFDNNISEVVAANDSPENQFGVGVKEESKGLYCEWVFNNNKSLEVVNALKDSNWVNSKEVEFGMLSYLGFPVAKPDGSLYGTLCVLDIKEHKYSEKHKLLMESFSSLIEDHLKMISNNYSLNKAHDEIQIKNSELNIKNQKLEELNYIKDKFFSIISHDLRSPFTSLMVMLEHILNNYDSNNFYKVQKHFANIYQHSKITYNLIENLLQWAKSQRKGLSFVGEYVNIVEQLNSCLAVMKESVKEKKINLTIKVEGEFSLYFDVNILNFVIRNILINAVKYSHIGGKVTINAYKRGEFSLVEIIDNGIGMSDDKLKSIFKIDSSSSSKGTLGEKGTGLGLILCYEFMKKYNGDIVIISKECEGTRVTLKFPDKTA